LFPVAAKLGFNFVLITFEPTLNSIMFFKVLKFHVGCWHSSLCFSKKTKYAKSH
jgi:hypothetical protein